MEWRERACWPRAERGSRQATLDGRWPTMGADATDCLKRSLAHVLAAGLPVLPPTTTLYSGVARRLDDAVTAAAETHTQQNKAQGCRSAAVLWCPRQHRAPRRWPLRPRACSLSPQGRTCLRRTAPSPVVPVVPEMPAPVVGCVCGGPPRTPSIAELPPMPALALPARPHIHASSTLPGNKRFSQEEGNDRQGTDKARQGRGRRVRCVAWATRE